MSDRVALVLVGVVASVIVFVYVGLLSSLHLGRGLEAFVQYCVITLLVSGYLAYQFRAEEHLPLGTAVGVSTVVYVAHVALLVALHRVGALSYEEIFRPNVAAFFAGTAYAVVLCGALLAFRLWGQRRSRIRREGPRRLP